MVRAAAEAILEGMAEREIGWEREFPGKMKIKYELVTLLLVLFSAKSDIAMIFN